MTVAGWWRDGRAQASSSDTAAAVTPAAWVTGARDETPAQAAAAAAAGYDSPKDDRVASCHSSSTDECVSLSTT